MSEWIKVEDQLPEEGLFCWICHKDNNVETGYFTDKAHDFGTFPMVKGIGWETDRDRSDYVMLKDITYWMAYFTPEPPQGNEDIKV